MMIAFLKRKVPVIQGAQRRKPRNRQQNIKATDDCKAAFAALADAHGVSKAALFEDMVAERFETMRQ
jgi:hypothetical protein